MNSKAKKIFADHFMENAEKEFIRVLPLLAAVDELLESERNTIIIAIDGRCASGKTTLAGILEEIYDCNVFHMDDFFLTPEMRTEERLSRPGENVDHERFLAEVLRPVKAGKNAEYQRYDCTAQALQKPDTITHKRLNFVEGAYSLHPSLINCYDLRVFYNVKPDEQKKRIIFRNSPEKAEKFFTTWIKLEENYFSAFKIPEKCDIII